MKMYLSLPALLLALLNCSPNGPRDSASPAPAVEREGYTLVWSDEFSMDGKPDSSFWSYESGFVRNEELQWYQPENVSCVKGKLVIEGRKERIGNDRYEPSSGDWKKNREYAEYTSSSIHTRDKFSFQYGLMEVKARLDTARGMWPAIWTLGVAKGWPSNGEIDVMEFYRVEGRPTIAWGDHWSSTIWDSEKRSLAHFLKKDPDWPTKFHVWTMDWTRDYIKLYLDDELLNEIDLAKTLNGDGFNPFHQPHYILLNLAIGSNGGNPAVSSFRGVYEVDYVRVFKKTE